MEMKKIMPPGHARRVKNQNTEKAPYHYNEQASQELPSAAYRAG
jgi:hypothetical protein